MKISDKYLNVLDEVSGSVIDETSERKTLSGSALIEHYDSIGLRIEELAIPFVAPGTRASMQNHHGLALSGRGLDFAATDEKEKFVCVLIFLSIT